LARKIEIRFFTLDASGVTRIDPSDPAAVVGTLPVKGEELALCAPTNVQSSEKRIRRAVTSIVSIFEAPGEE